MWVENVLVTDWCQQYPSHSQGQIQFGPDGALYASSGDGAAFGFADWGQDGNPLNPCGDPPGGVGAVLSPPTAEGGSLRAQDLRTSGDPVTLDGSIIRVNPDNGAALSTNPLFSNSDLNARRIIAHGMRNPFRIAFRPGTSELWVGDVGLGRWKRSTQHPCARVGQNAGWPCYEGRASAPSWSMPAWHLHEPLRGGPVGGARRVLLGLDSARSLRRDLPLPKQLDLGSRLLPGRVVSGRRQQRPVLLRLIAQADLGDAGGATGSRTEQRLTFVARRPARPAQDRAGRRAVRPRLRRRDDPADRYVAANEARSRSAQATPTNGIARLVVSFDGSGSSDPRAARSPTRGS